jgi:PLP dependent protein
MSVRVNLEFFKREIEQHKAKLIAVSKTHSEEKIMEAYSLGHKEFGENKVQELVSKAEKLPKDIQWHMIGHLQRNKVKYIAPFVQLIHAVDSLKLLAEINKEALKNERVIDVLLQIHIAEEESKFGLDEQEALDLVSSSEFKQMQNVRIKGLMGMATFTNDTAQVRKEFKGLKKIFDQLKSEVPLAHQADYKELSMGMSGDYQIALEEGSTMVRIGSAIFGER